MAKKIEAVKTKTTSVKKTTSEKNTTTKKAPAKAVKDNKKRLIVSYEKLPEKARILFDEKYVGDSYTNYIQKQEIPGRDPLYLVPLETEEAIYMVKVTVVIDNQLTDEEIEKQVFVDEDEKDEFEIERNKNGKGFNIIHSGNYDDLERSIEQQANDDMTDEQDLSFEDDIIETITPDLADNI